MNAGSTIPIHCGACRRRYGVVPVGPGVHTVVPPELKTGTVKPRTHCGGVRLDASRQFVAGRLGRTGKIGEGIRMRSYIPGNATDQTRFGAKK